MKKLLFLFILAVLMIGASSCNRDMCPGSVSNPDQPAAICKK